MTVSAEFIELLKDQMRDLGPVTSRRMFGGAGLFADGAMFGLIADDVLFLKADDRTKSRFEDEGLEPFTYEASGGKRAVMSYWRAPERLLDDPDEMCEWAGAAMAVARRAAAAKPPKKKKTVAKSKKPQRAKARKQSG